MKTAALLMVPAMGVLPLLAEAPAIIAHRGASISAPENTLAAFREAWNQKADGIELDIWLTKDGRIVVIHDGSTKRTTGEDLVVGDHSLDELRKLDAGGWKGEKWKGEPIPTLEETLKALPDGKTVYIEIKCGPEVMPELARVISASGKPMEQLRIIGFSFDTLVKAKALMPAVKTLWLVSSSKNKITGKTTYPDLAGLAEKAAAAGLTGLDLNTGFPLDAEAVAAIKAKGLSLAVWTVNDPAEAKRFATTGVNAINTDQPARIRSALEP
ncbi:MAG: glycerophosphodiester phosphodiesterase [Luteolibacter sp.]|uniref:glycerophosphodiester phosphodiesterase n=1 Tax=Luteolibacter sp. TaxID=1962973 RepID=UPI003263B266